MLTLALVLSLSCGAPRTDSSSEKKVMPNNETAASAASSIETAKSATLTIQQGAVGELGRYRVGVSGARNATEATLSVWPQDAPQLQRNDYNAKMIVKKGDVVPIGGALYRVADVINDSSLTGGASTPAAPGSSRLKVLIETQPAALANIEVQPDSFVITSGGTGELHGREIEVTDITLHQGKPTARLEMWSNNDEKAAAASHKGVVSQEIAAGDMLNLGNQRHRVKSIVAPDAARGVRGWVALDFQPER